MSHDDDWLKQLLKQWTTFAPEVREALHQYLQLPPEDRKNQCRMEKTLKWHTEHSVPGRPEITQRNAHV